jgi:putative tricarboxylic transport membrane protein
VNERSAAMTPAAGPAPAATTHEAGPRPVALAAIGAGLLVMAAAVWIDAAHLPAPAAGVGPAVAPRIVSVLLAVLGIAHGVAAWRSRGSRVRADRGNHRSLTWVMGALLGLIAVMQLGGGFVLGAAWLFIGTARGFGEPIRLRSVLIGIVLSLLVYLFFTQALSLALPSGPIERLLVGKG